MRMAEEFVFYGVLGGSWTINTYSILLDTFTVGDYMCQWARLGIGVYDYDTVDTKRDNYHI